MTSLKLMRKGGADMSSLQKLQKDALRLPLKPGVYIMKNKEDEVIYV